MYEIEDKLLLWGDVRLFLACWQNQYQACSLSKNAENAYSVWLQIIDSVAVISHQKILFKLS